MDNPQIDTLQKADAAYYKDSNLSIKKRVDDLLNKMTLKEKVAQMLCVWNQKKDISYTEMGSLDFSKMEVSFENGMGQVGRISDTWGGLSAVQMVKLTNDIQKYLVEETRLGIPTIFHEECLHGLAAKDATSYPQPIGLAATFNPSLVEEIYTAIAEDARSRGAHQALTPVVDVARDPRWGRVEETFGEDPHLIAQMGKAAIRGFQGDGAFNNKNRVIATLKHFAAHGQPESGSNCGPANISERVLRDVFLAPFKEVIEETKPLSIMASYNEIDGIPSHANKWLLRKVLRDEWGFDGFIVSDYYAITELNSKEETVSHSVAKNKIDAALLAVNAGINIELPEVDCYPNLITLVESGVIEESVINELVAPMLHAKFLMGLFEDPYVDPVLIDFDLKLESDRAIALSAAQETITLLKNEGNLLPLKLEDDKTIAVIGPNANRVLLGGYSGEPKFYSTVFEGIKNKVGNKYKILHSEGCKITINGSWNEDPVTPSNPEEDKLLIKEAVETAQKSDVVILVLGGNEQTSREAWNKDHMGDRPNLDLVGMQNELVKQILDTGKQVVVLLFNGRPNSINFINENVPSILECWYLGQEAGNAVADVIFGDVNPSGKLPISIPRSAGHVPCHYNHKPSSRRGYLFDDISALYSFGYGLSYTSFKFSNVKLDKDKINLNETSIVSVDVANIGEYEGAEVVQMYIRDIVSSVTRPVKELKGFSKVSLKPGETKTISFEISTKQLAFTDVNMNYTVEPGEFEIMLGNSSRDKDLYKVILEVLK
ncbi:MAG: glycoside hydrolase family 3 C-terminal domain-containing protein [Bacteroidetes bacterium]|nr:glycoside hydrolase family 3 C-terminal domain-containing protein [Bacteroidota bacterium]MBU1117090.1 glycoside hydrolase family 3 C-terminal domain-containing protein [Bacteroidota bacterium]MBU1797218.1 glycoside hydrolase family 3 C-terminal domain-containing protein [Bacteroidota bacterium]